MNEVNWEKVRKEFAVTRETAYFQSAGMSPIPQKVYKKLRQAYKKLYYSGDKYWPQDMETMGELLADLANMTGSRTEDLIFMPNTSMAFSMVALALKRTFKEGFNLVTMQDEFPASNVPFEYQGINIKYVLPVDHQYSVKLIAERIDSDTKAIVCSYVQYGTGYRHDLEAIGKLAKEKDLLFIVNATQGFPVFPIDVRKMNIDVFSASLHKWGCAAHVGALFYTSEEFRQKFPAPMAGWLSVFPPDDDFIPTQKGETFKLFPGASQYTMGTSNLQSLLGLKTAFEFMGNIGWKNISSRISDLTMLTLTLLKDIEGVEIITPMKNSSELSGIISINLIGKDNQQCVEFLETLKVVTSLRQKNIRIACNYFNNEMDITQLINGLKTFICRHA